MGCFFYCFLLPTFTLCFQSLLLQLIQTRVQLQEAHLSESSHGLARLVLGVEVDLDREPVGDGRVVREADQVAPHARSVQELPLTSVVLGRGRAQETVQEGGQLGPGQEAGTVLQIEDQGAAVGPRPVHGEQERS